ncbi:MULTISPECIES: hydrolase 1, exosortase A system-associated [unclassified Duganella]|uniref:hydrolase 1, exosortase A system-associated n=1 Tax=unclassified Duganella TaxID=2636909 RepID=UPI0007017E5D|nr:MULTISPECIES: hydrolase 1, exosortase A system-associated [unclassified Duganella]KQV59032.1 hydrolase [Duganella sp. Root336D2]KRC02471.1 hydrolase [Duganella sp. Root198D2]
MPDDRALSFACGGDTLVGILSPAAGPAARGVLVIVGGPQYRAGSHRQFTLLARALAARGIPVLRFDYRGLGDSAGAARGFEQVEEDIGAAIDAFQAALPGLREVVLWGLCDGAAAALFYGHRDARVAGLVLLNPWARTAAGLARSTLKHYYWQRLREPELWRKLFSGRFAARAALHSMLGLLGAARRPAAPEQPAGPAAAIARDGSAPPLSADLPARLLEAMQRFQGRVLFIFSGADLTAQEFLDMTKASRRWQQALAAPAVQQHTLAGADHTFSTRAWRDQVADWTAQWVLAW